MCTKTPIKGCLNKKKKVCNHLWRFKIESHEIYGRLTNFSFLSRAHEEANAIRSFNIPSLRATPFPWAFELLILVRSNFRPSGLKFVSVKCPTQVQDLMGKFFVRGKIRDFLVGPYF